MPRRLAALRLLLLVLVAFGVAGMHTMGHPGDRHSTMSMAASYETPAMHAAVMPVASLVAGGESAGLPGSGGGLDPSEVCLAILTAA